MSPSAPKSGSEPAEASAAAILRVPADAVEALARASHDLASTLAGQAPAADGLARLARSRPRPAPRRRGPRGRRRRGRPNGAPSRRAPGAFAREAADLSRRQASATSAVEGAATRVRAAAERLALVPAETVLAPLARSLRETAREQGREVDIDLRGLALPVERGTLQALKDSAAPRPAQRPEPRLAGAGGAARGRQAGGPGARAGGRGARLPPAGHGL
ncbi:hypothetical protein ACU4GA_00090 [Methylobacterium oryzae CBMB20]